MIDRTSTMAGSAPRVVELRSDTFTLPTPAMLHAMIGARLGDDVYAEDPTVRELESRAAGTLGKDAACFMPSGTMANLASIMTHCPRGSKVIVGDESDIYVYEAGGASVCGGIMYHPIHNEDDGSLDLDAVEAAFPPDPDDPQFATPTLLCLENPQNHSGGRILPRSYLADAAALARDRGIAVHLDGARIFNAALASGVGVDEIAGYADSVQFCLSKGLGAPVGSMVVGTAPFVERVRRVRKMLGGGMRQAGLLAAAGITALERRDRLVEDHETARRLAAGLATVPHVRVDPIPVQMNMVFFRIVADGWDVDTFLAAARARGVLLAELGRGRIRAVTHHGVGTDDVDHALVEIRAVLGGPPTFPHHISPPTLPHHIRRCHVEHDPGHAG